MAMSQLQPHHDHVPIFGGQLTLEVEEFQMHLHLDLTRFVVLVIMPQLLVVCLSGVSLEFLEGAGKCIESEDSHFPPMENFAEWLFDVAISGAFHPGEAMFEDQSDGSVDALLLAIVFGLSCSYTKFLDLCEFTSVRDGQEALVSTLSVLVSQTSNRFLNAMWILFLEIPSQRGGRGSGMREYRG